MSKNGMFERNEKESRMLPSGWREGNLSQRDLESEVGGRGGNRGSKCSERAEYIGGNWLQLELFEKEIEILLLGEGLGRRENHS